MTTNFAEQNPQVAIVVEGGADEKFLKDYCAEIFSVQFTNQDFINLGTDLRGLEKVKTHLVRHLESGKKLLLILDADRDTPKYVNGGFAKRQNAIIAWLKDAGISAEVFLWPNNAFDGELETMLEQIALEKHSQIFVCFKKYEECLQSAGKNYLTPDEGAKIYAYVEALGVKEKNDTKRNYRDAKIWNLNAKFLMPLNNFLSKNLKR